MGPVFDRKASALLDHDLMGQDRRRCLGGLHGACNLRPRERGNRPNSGGRGSIGYPAHRGLQTSAPYLGTVVRDADSRLPCSPRSCCPFVHSMTNAAGCLAVPRRYHVALMLRGVAGRLWQPLKMLVIIWCNIVATWYRSVGISN